MLLRRKYVQLREEPDVLSLSRDAKADDLVPALVGTLGRRLHGDQESLRVRCQEMVQKLKFQNSFDTGPKPRLPKAKDHDKSQPTQVRVAEYRTSKEAEAKVAELQKKGVKATLKKTKDSKGTTYIVYKPTSPVQPVAEKVVQKPEKSSGATHKPKAE